MNWFTPNVNGEHDHSLLGLVDVGATLAQVEVRLLLRVDALDLQQSRVLVLVPQPALKPGEHRLHVQSGEEKSECEWVHTGCEQEKSCWFSSWFLRHTACRQEFIQVRERN